MHEVNRKETRFQLEWCVQLSSSLRSVLLGVDVYKNITSVQYAVELQPSRGDSKRLDCSRSSFIHAIESNRVF